MQCALVLGKCQCKYDNNEFRKHKVTVEKVKRG